MHTTTNSPTGTRTHGHFGTTPQTTARITVPPRHTRPLGRFLAGAAALALAATGAIAVAPGTAIADTHRDGQWYLDDFNIDKVHKLSQGEGVKIGVIDSGIDANHPDLKNNIEKGAEFVADGQIDGDGHKDPIGHGTAVTSVLAGHGHGKNNANGILGIAPKATIIPVAVDWEKDAESARDNFADGVRYLIEQDVNIINVSLQAGATADGMNAIEEAIAKGIPVVGGAGNYHRKDVVGGDTTSRRTEWPAREPGVIPVAGTDQNHQSWKDSAYLEEAALQPQLGISAPASQMPVAQPDSKYDVQEGTSLAAPIVAGTLALIKSAYPNLDLYLQSDRLLDTVDDKGPEGFDDKYGWGIVNPYKALTKETTYTDAQGKDTVSSPDDRLPLNEQGDPVKNVPAEDTGPTPKIKPNPDDQDETDHATDTSPAAPPTWLVTTIVATGALLIAALITLVTIKTRRNKKHATASQTPPPGMPPPPDHLPQATPPPHGTPPGHTPPGTPPPPPGPNPNLGTPPQQPTNTTPLPENPNQPPPQTHQAGNQTPQPPPDPNTNPPQ